MAKQLRLGVTSLQYVCPSLTRAQAKALSVDLAHAMKVYNITTPKRAAMFIAQVAHESVEFHYREEIASGVAYEWRKDLGNVVAGDGVKFKGRGFIQITGRSNYAAIGRAFHPGHPEIYLRHPQLLANRTNAALSAAWWFKTHHLNELADSGSVVRVTRVINGGTNGLAQRQAYYKRARRVSRFLVPKVR